MKHERMEFNSLTRIHLSPTTNLILTPLMLLSKPIVPGLVDTHPDCLLSGRGSGHGFPGDWLCVLCVSVLWEVWWRLLHEAEPRLDHVLLHHHPTPLYSGTPVRHLTYILTVTELQSVFEVLLNAYE